MAPGLKLNFKDLLVRLLLWLLKELLDELSPQQEGEL
jgi:hypothetical protein